MQAKIYFSSQSNNPSNIWEHWTEKKCVYFDSLRRSVFCDFCRRPLRIFYNYVTFLTVHGAQNLLISGTFSVFLSTVLSCNHAIVHSLSLVHQFSFWYSNLHPNGYLTLYPASCFDSFSFIVSQNTLFHTTRKLKGNCLIPLAESSSFPLAENVSYGMDLRGSFT
jgi:hypothetical protein